jgi:hypothetical protein
MLLLIVIAFAALPGINAREKGWLLNWSPVKEDLLDVFMINADDGWIVGDGGTILHWNGSSWTSVQCPVDTRLTSVFMRSSTDGVAVGVDGVTIFWNGTDWSNISIGNTVHLLDVVATTSTLCYAVGTSGSIILWNGTSWQFLPSIPTSEDLRGIDLYRWELMPPFSYTWGWVVGSSGTTIYRNDTGWYSRPCPISAQLNDVCMVRDEILGIANANDVWAAGSSYENMKQCIGMVQTGMLS